MKNNDYVWEEWDRMVDKARSNMEGNCPLLEDEVILAVESYLKQLEWDILDYDSKS